VSSGKEQAHPILIIDGNPSDRAVIRQHLTKYEREFPLVDEVESGTEALQSIRKQVPICCILDYRLAGQNGLAFLRTLRREFSPDVLPVVVVTSESNEDIAVVMLQYGAQNYLLKEQMTASRLYGVLWNSIRASSLEKQLKHLAHFDALTGLLNRNLLMNRLELALKRCDRYKQRCALLYLDLNNFKAVNDTYGHAAGDLLLQAVAERIRTSCRSTDSPARIGGDEFVVLLEQVDSTTGLKVADKLLKAIDAPFEIEGHQLSVGASLGLAIYPDTARTAEELIKQADQALNRAKHDSPVRFVSFSEQHQQQWHRQHRLETELPKAIANGDLALAYQPIVRASDFELMRVEALSRWPRDDFPVNPFELIELIDRLNLIEPFHEWLFHTAFGQMKLWERESVCPDLCLNIPANYCYSDAISGSVLSAMNFHRINPQKLELEITESTLMRFPEKSTQILRSLHDHGMRIAIDDFGTGYSSMAYLTRLPLDTLKIDRDFFLVDVEQERNRKVIEAITALGHSLELEIVAEGVETEVQLALAQRVGCDLLQGFYFGKPAFAGTCWSDYRDHFKHLLVAGR
jgi:diguanylate cyclase